MVTNVADVAIVGAGPAGSVAAQRLAAAGVEVVLLEQAAFPRDKACGDGVSAAGLAALARTGLGEWARQFPAPEVLDLARPTTRCSTRGTDRTRFHQPACRFPDVSFNQLRAAFLV